MACCIYVWCRPYPHIFSFRHTWPPHLWPCRPQPESPPILCWGWERPPSSRSSGFGRIIRSRLFWTKELGFSNVLFCLLCIFHLLSGMKPRFLLLSGSGRAPEWKGSRSCNREHRSVSPGSTTEIWSPKYPQPLLAPPHPPAPSAQ